LTTSARVNIEPQKKMNLSSCTRSALPGRWSSGILDNIVQCRHESRPLCSPRAKPAEIAEKIKFPVEEGAQEAWCSTCVYNSEGSEEEAWRACRGQFFLPSKAPLGSVQGHKCEEGNLHGGSVQKNTDFFVAAGCSVKKNRGSSMRTELVASAIRITTTH